ncbi:MAG: outer membrane lipoprotein carrier protein LolA [Thiomargarita sp.]|nr:outer membrane lipoprotein carrier protein LolA [Thiomargarita sp.]
MHRLSQVVLVLSLICIPLRGNAALFQLPVDLEHPTPEFLRVTQGLQSIHVMRSHFLQRKQIKILRNPLISKGNMLFSAKNGLYWHIESPVNNMTIFTEEGIFEKRNGVMIRQKTASMGHFGTIFGAIFTGDITTLSTHFKLYFSDQGEFWRLGLIPKNGMLQKAFHKIVLKGKRQVEEIVLEDARGDTTVLQFFKIKTMPARLTPIEQKYFE